RQAHRARPGRAQRAGNGHRPAPGARLRHRRTRPETHSVGLRHLLKGLRQIHLHIVSKETPMKNPVRVAVTGAAGQIGYSLLFRIASGEMLGKDQPVILQLLELPMEKAQAALKGVMMELEDCAFPLLAGMIGTDDAEAAFKDADIALLVGAR